jgi:hypothetical protein
MTTTPFKLKNLPATLPEEEAIRIELVEGIPIFRASREVQERVESLLEKQSQEVLNSKKEQEFDDYENLDDYLSLVNRTIRNLSLKKSNNR